MKMRRYEVKLTGETPLLLHNDNIEWADALIAWRAVPDNRKKSVAGDDRSPAHTWIGSLYINDGVISMPSDNLMTTIRNGAAKVPTGKRGATFKRQSQSGIVVDQVAWPLAIDTDGTTVGWDAIEPLMHTESFPEHMVSVRNLGFELFCKRARVGASKHIRVRPRFDTWSCSGTITVLDETITEDILREILTHAGSFSGLGDWRPSAPQSPGPYGRFTAEVKAIR